MESTSPSSLTSAVPSFRAASPLPQVLRSAAASSSSSLSSLFQLTSSDPDYLSSFPHSSPSDELRAHAATIVQAFGPTVAVVATRECEDLVRSKGLAGGLFELLRPFGDAVAGKVNIRDSQALTLPVDDFTVKFIDFNYYAQQGGMLNGRDTEHQGPYAPKKSAPNYIAGGDLSALERLMEQRVDLLRESETRNNGDDTGKFASGIGEYSFFLRRVLSGIPLSAHETFTHPVACILAVSSRHPEPIDALLGLYNTTNNAPIPRYLDSGFLRLPLNPVALSFSFSFEADVRSNAILEKMKRSLGLHCTILRLNTVQDAKDLIPFHKSSWISAGEELNQLVKAENVPSISTADKQALQKFVRDMVTQSIVPHMERCITTWNDQIASYRRGLAGRVFTASRRLFSSSSSRSATPTSGSGNYDISTSSYPPSTPEAQMRKLADYAFMLRDWRLAHSTYDIVRKDFGNDKAWKYAAGAQEMTAITFLLLQSAMTQTKLTETLDPLLDSAIYSYTARSSSPYFSLRTTLVSVELLTLRGGSAPDDAVKWASRALSAGTLGDIGSCLLVERIAGCYKISRPRRRRKMALWSMLACEAWSGVGCRGCAARCLRDAWGVYKGCDGFSRIGRHMAGLMENLGVKKDDEGEKMEEVVDMQEMDEGMGEQGITVEFA